jgi:hypothetical protein
VFGHYGYLFFHSTAMRSGKTTALNLVSTLAFDATAPLNAPTSAALRDMAARGQTMVLDTLERWREKSPESYGAIMELLEAGFRNGGVVIKQVPHSNDGFRPKEFPVYAPYAMAGINIGSLTDTALDRALPVEMHRKAASVKKRRYTDHATEQQCAPIRDVLYQWALRAAERVWSEYDSVELDQQIDGLHLNDRAGDVWRPIFAVARALNHDAASIHRLCTLAIEMGGDPDALADREKLLIVKAIRSKVQNGTVTATTTQLLEAVAVAGAATTKHQLTMLLKSWGFEQATVRLPEFPNPHRAWKLRECFLERIEKKLAEGLG